MHVEETQNMNELVKYPTQLHAGLEFAVESQIRENLFVNFVFQVLPLFGGKLSVCHPSSQQLKRIHDRA